VRVFGNITTVKSIYIIETPENIVALPFTLKKV
jgi:hypothetical protein